MTYKGEAQGYRGESQASTLDQANTGFGRKVFWTVLFLVFLGLAATMLACFGFVGPSVVLSGLLGSFALLCLLAAWSVGHESAEADLRFLRGVGRAWRGFVRYVNEMNAVNVRIIK